MTRKVKKPSLADAILHPQRLQMLRMFSVHGPQTVRELAALLPKISQATLYRHVKALQASGAIVASEIRTPERGAPETAYALVEEVTTSLRLHGAQRSPGSMRRYFAAVQASVIAAFERRLARGPIPSTEFAVRSAVIYVNRDELREVARMFDRLKALEINRGKGRKPFSLSLALFSEPEN